MFSAIVSFFLGPYILGKLGATSYGIWALIGSLVGYFGLLDLGVRSAVTKFVASYHSAGNHDGASDVKSAALLAFTMAGFLAIVIDGSVYASLFRLRHIEPDLTRPFAAYGYPLLPALPLALTVGLFVGLVIDDWKLSLYATAMIALSFLLYAVTARGRTRGAEDGLER